MERVKWAGRDMNKIYINGVSHKVYHPMEIIRAFWVYDKSFLEYDLKKVITVKDAIELSPKIGARIKAKTLLKYLPKGKRDRIKTKLKTIPNEDLIDIGDKRWQQIKNDVVGVINFTKCKNVGISRATKILHKLRPGIFPILDNDRIQKMIYKDKKNKPDDLIDAIRKDIRASRKLLLQLQKDIKETYPLTTTRLFDILLWAKSKEDEIGIARYFFEEVKK